MPRPAPKSRRLLFLGPDSVTATARFNTRAKFMGLAWTAHAESELPAAADPIDRIVGANADLASLQHRFPNWSGELLTWPADVTDDAALDAAVSGLIARLLGGQAAGPEPVLGASSKPKPPAAVVKVGRETKGRRGKGVTIVSELPLAETELLELAATLKGRCGSGSTVKDGRIEIQGDHRDRLTLELEKLGYRVKRTGG